MRSHSVVSGNHYELPKSENDIRLKEFFLNHQQREVVAVQGLGFVGVAMALVVANSKSCSQYAVVGIDRATEDSYWKIGDINDGRCPIVSSDPAVGEYFERCQLEGNFIATFDETAYSQASIIIVDINLDVTKSISESGLLNDFDVPLSGFEKAIRTIGRNCRSDALIIVETTVPPGTCSKIVKPILQEELEKRGLPSAKLKVGHSYERVMPGPHYIASIENFYRVYSGVDERSADAVEVFLKSVISTEQYPLTRLQNTESTEMAKVLENSYRAMNISFMVEWSRFAESAKVNLFEVVNAIRLRPTHANLMYPGIGVGGYCLTKDPLIASWASEEFFQLSEGLPSSVKAVEINDQMPGQAFSFTTRCIGRNIQKHHFGLLGVAYGPGIGDTRFSPVEPYARLLLEAGAEISLCDPYVNHWEELGVSVLSSVAALLDREPSVLVVTTGHRAFLDSDGLYARLAELPRAPILIDTVGLLNEEELDERYSLGINFFVLGVGNS